MTAVVPAIYENGVLRLLAPLALPEHTEVQVYVQMPPADNIEHHRRVRAALHQAGLSLAAADALQSQDPISPQLREELARLFATGQPLSETIIEERSGR